MALLLQLTESITKIKIVYSFHVVALRTSSSARDQTQVDNMLWLCDGLTWFWSAVWSQAETSPISSLLIDLLMYHGTYWQCQAWYSRSHNERPVQSSTLQSSVLLARHPMIMVHKAVLLYHVDTNWSRAAESQMLETCNGLHRHRQMANVFQITSNFYFHILLLLDSPN